MGPIEPTAAYAGLLMLQGLVSFPCFSSMPCVLRKSLSPASSYVQHLNQINLPLSMYTNRTLKNIGDKI